MRRTFQSFNLSLEKMSIYLQLKDPLFPLYQKLTVISIIQIVKIDIVFVFQNKISDSLSDTLRGLSIISGILDMFRSDQQEEELIKI